MNNNWTFDDNAFSRLQQLMMTIAPSMNEVYMANLLRNLWQKYDADVHTDVMGNTIATFNLQGKIHVGVIAHMDSVAIQITNILPSGLMQFRSIGLRPHTLLGQAMKVVTRNGIIDGVIGFDPTSQYGQPKGLIEEDLWLDVGARGYDEAFAMVECGDVAVLSPRIGKLGEYDITGTSIDDRIGVFIMNECLPTLNNALSNVCLHFIGSVQEEVGLRGAAIIGENLNLDACIVLDVDYATDTLTPHSNQMGNVCLGRGAGLHVKADNNPVMRNLAREVAARSEIAYQVSVGRYIYGGTDGTSLQLQNRGVATLNINIPCRYMHSPVEVCDVRDVENAIRLLQRLIEEIDNRNMSDFTPKV